MKKFLRCKACGRLLSLEGKWVEDVLQARQFDSMEQVQEAVKLLDLPDVDIYFSFEDEFHSPRWDFEIEFHEGAKERTD